MRVVVNVANEINRASRTLPAGLFSNIAPGMEIVIHTVKGELCVSEDSYLPSKRTDTP